MEAGQDLRLDEREKALAERRRAHDRIRVVGMLAILVFILLLTLLRFGKTIPWSAR
jgi:hypothetical protein